MSGSCDSYQGFYCFQSSTGRGGSGLGWGRDQRVNVVLWKEDTTRCRFAFDPVGTGVVVGAGCIMMGSEDREL